MRYHRLRLYAVAVLLLTTVSLGLTVVPAGAATLPSVTMKAGYANASALVKSWDGKIPALERDLGKGDSFAQALEAVGLPAITAHRVGANTGSLGRVRPEGVSCQDWSCGWEFSSLSTFELEWAIWASATGGPSLICLLAGPETLGVACAVAGAVWALLEGYFYSPPSYNPYQCLYVGTGFNTVARLDYC